MKTVPKTICQKHLAVQNTNQSINKGHSISESSPMMCPLFYSAFSVITSQIAPSSATE